MLDMIR